MNQKNIEGTIFFVFLLAIALIAITRFTSIRPHWGSLEMRSTSTITVTGTAKKDQINQIANFTAGVESIETSKEAALSKVNENMNQLIEKVKDFGIKAEDIETQSANVYQNTQYINQMEGAESSGVTTMMYPQPPLPSKAVKGDWYASNSITIKLREVDRVDGLLAILNNSGANNISGPNFSLDDVQALSDGLLTEAVANARFKAEQIAAANKQKVGKMISVSENGAYPYYGAYESAIPMMAFDRAKTAVDVNLEPGSSQTSKSVTVTFELE